MPASRSHRRARLAALARSSWPSPASSSSPPPAAQAAGGTGLVISEVYGGGRQRRRGLHADFVELYNPPARRSR